MSKGRVSNELVAASCAAVLAVYAAGYWRTRDDAKRMETQAQERRPMRLPAVEIKPEVPVIETPEPVIAMPEPESPPAAPPEPVVAKTPAKKAPKPAAVPEPEPEPAAPAVLSVPLPPEPDLAASQATGAQAQPPQRLRDGTYTGWGQSYHGDIEARVIIEHGRIVGSGVASCATRYPCDVIDTILYQPIERQSAEVDRVSRATESSDAYYYGLQEALNKAYEAGDTAPASSQ